MSAFWGFIRKEFYHILRDRRTMVILFGMPLLQLILFGYAIRNELNNVDIAFLNQSNDVLTTQIINTITSSGYFNMVAHIDSPDGIERVFRSGKARVVVVFEPEFMNRLTRDGVAKVQIITDASDPNMAQMTLGYLSAIITPFAPQKTFIIPEVRMMFNPELRSANLFVPGLMAFILMLISALMTSITIAREKELGTMEVLLASPLRPIHIILGKVVPYLLLSMFNVVTILITAHLVFDVPFEGSYTLFFLLALLFTITALSLGMLISNLVHSQQTAMMISLAGLLLPTILLSGFIFPIENMPWILQAISHIVPAKWFLIIIKGIMLKGTSMDHIWLETSILAGMTLVLIGISVKKFKVRLDS